MESEKIRIYVFNIFITFVAVISILIFIDFTGITKSLNLVTVESLTDMGDEKIKDNLDSDISVDLARDFCKSHVGSSDKLVESCKKLTNRNCNSTSCCVMLNGKKCVPGDIDGPTFKTTDGEPIQIDYYYYQNKKYKVA